MMNRSLRFQQARAPDQQQPFYHVREHGVVEHVCDEQIFFPDQALFAELPQEVGQIARSRHLHLVLRAGSARVQSTWSDSVSMEQISISRISMI